MCVMCNVARRYQNCRIGNTLLTTDQLTRTVLPKATVNRPEYSSARVLDRVKDDKNR